MLTAVNIAADYICPMHQEILDLLPYKSSFRFVDEITAIDENGVTGNYTLREHSFFYEDHFPNNPVTPGVIITEIMAQIGLVILGIFLIVNNKEKHHNASTETIFPLLTSTEISLFSKWCCRAKKLLWFLKNNIFVFDKLKCYIEMTNEAGELIARGTFAGMIKSFNLNKNKL